MIDIQEFESAIVQHIAIASAQAAQQSAKPSHLLSSVEKNATRIAHELQQIIDQFRKNARLGVRYFLDSPLGQQQEIRNDLASAFRHLDSVKAINELGTKGTGGKSLAVRIRLSDKTLEALYLTAKSSFEHKQYEQAQALFTFLLLLDHTRATSWLGLGHSLFHLKQYEQAINAYTRSHKLDQNGYWPLICMANCFIAQDFFYQAISPLEQAHANYLASKQKETGLEKAIIAKVMYVKNRAKK